MRRKSVTWGLSTITAPSLRKIPTPDPGESPGPLLLFIHHSF
jgi:hypothetical protein